ncbi:hypothetical protein D3C81_2319850 [compost metagenome]
MSGLECRHYCYAVFVLNEFFDIRTGQRVIQLFDLLPVLIPAADNNNIGIRRIGVLTE